MAGAPTAATAYPQWETDLINAMGFAATQPVYEALNLWAESEGVAATSNNPLAVCCHPDGNTGCIAQCGPGGSPIYSYGTRAAGVAATASFLSGSNSSGIVAALRDPNATLGSIYAAINGSHWCYGCQNGHYPVDLFQALGGNAPATIFRGGASDSGGSSSSGGQPVAPSAGVGCSTGSQGVDILGAHLFTACQVKALVGGLLIGAGAGFLLTGTAILAMSALRGSKTGRAVAKYVPGPGKAAAAVVTRRATSTGSQARGAAQPGKRAATRSVKASGYSEKDVNDAFDAGRQMGSTEGPPKNYKPFGPADERPRPGARGSSGGQQQRARAAVGR